MHDNRESEEDLSEDKFLPPQLRIKKTLAIQETMDQLTNRLSVRTEIAEEAIRTLLKAIGRDPKSDGLKDTPKRVVKALMEMTKGYMESPEEILGRVFEDSYDEMILLRNISFCSNCEHHMLPFMGTADVAYIPSETNRKVVGLSKLARLVDCFACRLQLQERMTREIADALMHHLAPQGVGVIVRATHSCMGCRGIKKAGAEMVTSTTTGIFRDDPRTRAEFLALCQTGKN